MTVQKDAWRSIRSNHQPEPTNPYGEGGSNSGFAWQLIGGADYYFTEKVSAFLEYKFLNYEDAGLAEDRISQHLVMLGLRFHF